MDTLQVNSITKSYDDFKAVDGVTFSIQSGRIFGLLGPNGAGKTTTMRMIMNIIIPDQGSVKIFGQPFREEIKDRIGYLPEERGLYPKMKLLPHLQFLGEMKGLSGAKARKLAEEWLNRFDLLKWGNNKVQDLSKGMQQKVQFIGTIMHSPELLIVDEPFAGLDPINTKFLKDILLELREKGTTIILSTHLMDQAEKLCDDICLINRGKVVLQGELSEVKQRYSRNAVILEFSGEADQIKQFPFIQKINEYSNYMDIRLTEDATPQDLFKALADTRIQIKRFEAAETSLNDIFIEIVGDTKNEKDS